MKNMSRCDKIKFSKFEAMLVLAQAEIRFKKKKGKGKRRECRYYYCKECNAYHLTSKMSKIRI